MPWIVELTFVCLEQWSQKFKIQKRNLWERTGWGKRNVIFEFKIRLSTHQIDSNMYMSNC